MDPETHNQIMEELLSFRQSALYRHYIEIHKTQFQQAIQTIIQTPPTDIKTFLQREQNIGAAREIQAQIEFFDDLLEQNIIKQ